METGFPSSPIKRLERQIDRIQERQQVLERMVEENARVASEMARLPEKMDQLSQEISGFVETLRTTHNHNKRSTEINHAMLSHLSMINERLKRLHTQMNNIYSQERDY